VGWGASIARAGSRDTFANSSRGPAGAVRFGVGARAWQNADMADLAARLADYIARQMPHARDVSVRDLDRIFGGASRETSRFVLAWREDGEPRERRLILRRDPPGSLIETDRKIEFAAYRAFHGTAVPVPEALWLEEDAGPLDFPFFVMAEIPGLEASPQALFAPPYAAHLDAIAAQKWKILGEIAKADPEALGLVGTMPPVEPERAWRRELDHWEGVLREDAQEPQPVIEAVIRRLRRSPPPPPERLHVVHGDYRTGNFLFDAEGRIHAILDWEMAHLGDPLEDLAWGMNPIWHWGQGVDRVGGLATRADAIAWWEASSGLRADPDALHWWELFSCVKGQGIWVSGAAEYSDGKNQDPILGMSSWMMGNAQDRAALQLLGRLS